MNRNPLLAITLLALFVTACGEQADQEAEVLRTVKTIQVASNDSARLSTFSGVSQSARESRLSFKVAGTVAEVAVKVGQTVPAGATIASLDPSTYELQLQQSEANVAQLRAASRNARAAYERTRSLYANNNAALGDLDTARANSESADAQLRAANKSLQLARLNLDYTVLSVDLECVVDSISVEVNENVNTGGEIARVNCSDDIEVQVTVPESVVSQLGNGKAAQIKFDTLQDRVLATTPLLMR
ncbi:MAG: efflux RND transporter periplasmic adaptor subunit [Pseudomonadota bacterium]